MTRYPLRRWSSAVWSWPPKGSPAARGGGRSTLCPVPLGWGGLGSCPRRAAPAATIWCVPSNCCTRRRWSVRCSTGPPTRCRDIEATHVRAPLRLQDETLLAHSRPCISVSLEAAWNGDDHAGVWFGIAGRILPAHRRDRVRQD